MLFFCALRLAKPESLSCGNARKVVSSGQSATVSGLILALEGAGYVLADTAQALIATGQAHAVTGAPRIPQPVFAALPLRQRHRPLQRRLVTLLRAHFAARAPRT